MDLRKKNFKKGVDNDESRRKREDETVQIRKAKRDEQLAKKRMVNPEEDENDSENVPAVHVNVGGGNGLHGMAAQMLNGDLELRKKLTTDLRRMVSKTEGPPIQEAIEAGLVSLMVQFLAHEDQKLQFEAAWVLTNIASGTSEQTAAVVEAGAVPLFVQILNNGAPDTQEQVVWAVANIAGDSVKHRDMLLRQDAVTAMCKLLVANENRIGMLRNVTWAISNLCRGKPVPELPMVQMALPFLARLITCHDKEVLCDAIWAISYICDGSAPQIDAVLQSGAVAKIVDHAVSAKLFGPFVSLRRVARRHPA
jgi:hypothetical protein